MSLTSVDVKHVQLAHTWMHQDMISLNAFLVRLVSMQMRRVGASVSHMMMVTMQQMKAWIHVTPVDLVHIVQDGESSVTHVHQVVLQRALVWLPVNYALLVNSVDWDLKPVWSVTVATIVLVELTGSHVQQDGVRRSLLDMKPA